MNKPLLVPAQTPVNVRQVVRSGRKRVTHDDVTPVSSAAEQSAQETDLQTSAPAQQDLALDAEALDGVAKADPSSSSEVAVEGAEHPALQAQQTAGFSGTSVVGSAGVLAGLAATASMGKGRPVTTEVAAATPQASLEGASVPEPVVRPSIQPEAATPITPVTSETPAASETPVESEAPAGSAPQDEPVAVVSEADQAVADQADWLIPPPVSERISMFSIDGGKTWTPGTINSVDPSALAEGRNTIQVAEVDPEGNFGPISTVDIFKDTVAPQALQLAVVGLVGGDTPTPMINASGSISVGLVEDGATWAFSLDGGTTWVPGRGDSIDASELSEGDNTVLVMQFDEAGNRSLATSITVLKDSTAPSAPVVATAKPGALLINGTESVTVNTEAGTQWHYSIDGGQTWRAGIGNRIAASDLNEGLNTVQITQTDAAGNTSASTVVEVTKDTIAPLAPALGTGSILLNGNGVLNIATESGASWRFSLDDGSTWTTGTGSSLTASQLREGMNRVQVVQTDAAGNVSAAASVTVLKDSVAPDTPVLPTGPLAINAQGSVQVTATPGAWSFSLDGGQTWTAGTGTSITADQLREGNNSIAVIQSDAAGNLSDIANIDVRKDTMVEIPLFFVYQYAQSSGQQSYIWLANIEKGGKFQFQRTAGGAWEDGIGNTFNLENTVNNDHLEIVRFRQVDAVGNISGVYNFGYYY